jgi:hypothetical protein
MGHAAQGPGKISHKMEWKKRSQAGGLAKRRSVLLARCMHQQGTQVGNLIPHAPAVYNHVDRAMFQQKLATLKPFRQSLAYRLLDDTRSAYALAMRVFGQDGWDDPQMDEYNVLDPRR